MEQPCRRRAIWAKQAEAEQSPRPAPVVEPEKPAKKKPGRPRKNDGDLR